MTDHVPVEYWPPRLEYQRELVTEICAACSANGVAVPAADCELAAAVLQRTAYGACPMGCGAVGGDVDQAGDLAGFVRLWSHLWHGHDKPFRPEMHRGVTPARPMLRCAGSNSWTVPLPLAAPPDGERRRLLAEIFAAEEPVAVDDNGYPLTLF